MNVSDCFLGKLTVSSDGAAVFGGALDGAAPAHGVVALGCGQGRDLTAVDGDELGVLLGRVVELVCGPR